MREIKFRGKSEETGAWVYGYLVGGYQPYILGEIMESDPEYIIPEFWEPVDPETVGQFIGLLDKNNIEIYVGDKVLTDEDGWIGTVIYDRDIFMCEDDRGGYSVHCNWEKFAVIGNVHDN